MNAITEKEIRREAATYKSRAEFLLGSPGEFYSALESGTLDEACAHMVGERRYLIKWTPETITAEALKYNTRSEFARGSGGAYSTATRLGIRDDVCSHMIRKVKWTPETITAEALKYNTRSEFKKGSGGAYHAARNLKILDAVCLHMNSRIK